MGLGCKRRPVLTEVPALQAECIRLFRHIGRPREILMKSAPAVMGGILFSKQNSGGF